MILGAFAVRYKKKLAAETEFCLSFVSADTNASASERRTKSFIGKTSDGRKVAKRGTENGPHPFGH